MEAMKMDLRLLLECMKGQMKWPESQKNALRTILSICRENCGQLVEFFNEIGGVSFIYNLSKSSLHLTVKETALFTLSSLAESHDCCKRTLCREETFGLLFHLLEQNQPVTLMRVSLFLLSVLVTNSRHGQTLAMSSGCLESLLTLFRNSFPVVNAGPDQIQLWTAVCSALCGTVNNPQNEENQQSCVCLFPLVKSWLEDLALPRAEVAQHLCTFVAMTVANNAHAQHCFLSMGGLDSLSAALKRLLSQSKLSPDTCKMATVITRILLACISSNVLCLELLVPFLLKLKIIPELVRLLSDYVLEPQDQLSVVLTIGQLTETCVEQQAQLLFAGGFPIMISLLTDTTDEELKRAATFILHNCKSITKPPRCVVEDDEEQKTHKHSAGELFHRMPQLQKMTITPSVNNWSQFRNHSISSTLSTACDTESHFRSTAAPLVYRPYKNTHSIFPGNFQRNAGQLEANLMPSHHKARSEAIMKEQVMMGKKKRDRGNRLNMMGITQQDANRLFLPPAGSSRETQGPNVCDRAVLLQRERRTLIDPQGLSGSHSDEVRSFSLPYSSRNHRCAGCTLHFEDVDSRSFSLALHRSRARCDFHQAILDAEEKFSRSQHCLSSNHPQACSALDNGSSYGNLEQSSDDCQSTNSNRRTRQNWSEAELNYITEGVRRFGHSWNNILWAFPFSSGRTNVDLAKKFRRMQRAKRGGVRDTELP